MFPFSIRLYFLDEYCISTTASHSQDSAHFFFSPSISLARNTHCFSIVITPVAGTFLEKTDRDTLSEGIVELFFWMDRFDAHTLSYISNMIRLSMASDFSSSRELLSVFGRRRTTWMRHDQLIRQVPPDRQLAPGVEMRTFFERWKVRHGKEMCGLLRSWNKFFSFFILFLFDMSTWYKLSAPKDERILLVWIQNTL